MDIKDFLKGPEPKPCLWCGSKGEVDDRENPGWKKPCPLCQPESAGRGPLGGSKDEH